MTANPDSALRQALVAGKEALAPFDALNDTYAPLLASKYANDENTYTVVVRAGDLRRAREAHALIIEALQRGEK